MSNTQTVQPGADDAAKYEALRQELGIEEPAVPEPESQPELQPEPQPESEPDSQPKPSYEELEEHSRKTAGALKEAREQAQRERAEKAAILQIIEQARSQRLQPEQEPPKAPDVNEDPIGFFKAEVARLESQLQQAQHGSQRTAQELEADRQRQMLWGAVERSERDILDPKSQNHKADYYDACQHLESQRIAELEEMYPDGNPYVLQYARQMGFADAQQLKLAVLNHDRQAVAVQALQLGKSPAQVYYDLALRRGYQPKVSEQKKNGQLIADKAKQQIETTKRGLKASTTVSGGGGDRKGANDMTITDLADLFVEDPELADKMWDQMARQGRLG